MRNSAEKIIHITDCNENVPLESNGSKSRTQKKIRNPNPWTNDGDFPVVFEVAGKDTLSICVEIIKQNADRKSLFIPKGAIRAEKTLRTTRIASCMYSRPRRSISEALNSVVHKERTEDCHKSPKEMPPGTARKSIQVLDRAS